MRPIIVNNQVHNYISNFYYGYGVEEEMKGSTEDIRMNKRSQGQPERGDGNWRRAVT